MNILKTKYSIFDLFLYHYKIIPLFSSLIIIEKIILGILPALITLTMANF